VAFDQQLATYHDDVAGNWGTEFNWNGQTNAVSDLAFVNEPVETDPQFEDFASAAVLGLQQALWKAILLDRFVVTSMPGMHTAGKETNPPTVEVAEYYKAHPNFYVQWSWNSSSSYWNLGIWQLTVAPGTGYDPTPLSTDACSMLFVDSIPGTVINADGIYTRYDVFCTLGLKLAPYGSYDAASAAVAPAQSGPR
jgi:hypothetical protein